jgi:anthranilate/para-aminobenzoate synthase component I
VRLILELHAPAELEPALAAEGFFGREGWVARVYLGYGSAAPAGSREPCPLPPAAVAIERTGPGVRPRDGSFGVGAWRRSWDDEGYCTAIEAVRAAIRLGDVYQANLVQHLSADFEGDPHGLAAALAPLRPLEPEPLVGNGWAIVSVSPELFLSRRGRRVWTCPIKGTSPAGVSVDSPKDDA